MRPLVICLACLLTLLLAAPASAQRQIAPPGNGAIDEYLETLPGAGGNRPTDGNRQNDGALTPRSRSRLEALGADGKEAAALAEATAPGRDERSSDSSRGPTGGPEKLDGEGDSALETILSRLLGSGSEAGDSGSGGIGLLLPLILFLSLGGAIALAVFRRRSAHI